MPSVDQLVERKHDRGDVGPAVPRGRRAAGPPRAGRRRRRARSSRSARSPSASGGGGRALRLSAWRPTTTSRPPGAGRVESPAEAAPRRRSPRRRRSGRTPRSASACRAVRPPRRRRSASAAPRARASSSRSASRSTTVTRAPSFGGGVDEERPDAAGADHDAARPRARGVPVGIEWTAIAIGWASAAVSSSRPYGRRRRCRSRPARRSTGRGRRDAAARSSSR